MKDVEIAALCDVDERVVGDSMQVRRGSDRDEARLSQGFPEAPRGPVHRRGLDRHAEPLALARRRSGPARRARTSTSRSRVSHNVWRRPQGRRGRAEVRPDRPAGTQNRSAPGLREAVEFLHAGKLGKVKRRPRPLLQAARLDRQEARRARRPRASTTTLWLGPAPERPFNAEPVPLPVALELGLRQRRHRQPGHPRDGHGPLGPGQGRAAPPRGLGRGPVRLRGRRPDPQHPARRSSTTATAC